MFDSNDTKIVLCNNLKLKAVEEKFPKTARLA